MCEGGGRVTTHTSGRDVSMWVVTTRSRLHLRDKKNNPKTQGQAEGWRIKFQETNSPNGIGSFGYQFLPLPTHLTKFLLDKMALKRWDLSNKKFTISAPIKQMLEYDSDYLHLHLHFLSLSVVNFSKFKNYFWVFWLKTYYNLKIKNFREFLGLQTWEAVSQGTQTERAAPKNPVVCS